MALHVIQGRQQPESFAKTLASGLSNGVAALAQHKVNEMQQAKFAKMFEQNGYSPEASNLLATLQAKDPQGFHHILKQVSGGGVQQQQAPQQQQMQQPGQQQQVVQQQQKQPLFSGGNNEQDALKQRLLLEKLIPTVENLSNIRQITSRMKELLDKGDVNTGFIASKGSSWYGPTFNNPDTEEFEKLSHDLILQASDNVKGVQSNFRVKLRQNAKPGIMHSKEVNARIIDELAKRAAHQQSTFFQRNPILKEYGPQEGEQQQQQQKEQPQLMQDEAGNLYLNGRKLKRKGA